MTLLFYKHDRLVCRGDAAKFDSAKLLALHRLGWRWKIQRQALT